MGVASLYDRVHTFDCELDADFITLDCQVSYRINPGDGDAVPQPCELVKVTTRIAGAEGPVINITPIINFDYIMDLCEEDASNADVCVEDYL